MLNDAPNDYLVTIEDDPRFNGDDEATDAVGCAGDWKYRRNVSVPWPRM